MIKRRLIANLMMSALLFSFILQVAAFSSSISSRKNISGMVYASPGVALSGAIVTAYGSNGSGYAMTNANGQYLINAGLKSGTYTVMAVKDGYVNAQTEDVAVAVGSETSGVTIYMNRSGGISGKVTDSVSGLGIPNISVMAMPFSGTGTYYGAALTDVAGNYRITMNLGPTDYNVSVLLPNGYASKSQGPVTVAPGYMTTNVNLALDRSGIISGRVTTLGNQPLSNLTVTAVSSGGGFNFGSDQTNATGHYRIDSGLGNGTYIVMVVSGSAFDQAFADVTAGSETPNVDLQLNITPPPASGIIMGRVTDTSSKAIADAHVVADGINPGSYGDAYTDEDGYYVISDGLATDTYTVSASATGYVTANITNVNVVEAQITPNVNLQLASIPPAQSGRISGTVTGDENPIPEFQYPIAVMLVLTLVAVVIAKSSARCPTSQKQLRN